MKLTDKMKNKLRAIIEAQDISEKERMNELKEELTEIIVEHKAKEQEAEAEKEEKERKEFAERLATARAKKHNINKARKKAEQIKGYSPGRLALLRRQGKVD